MKAIQRPPMSPKRKPLHTLLPLEEPLSLFIDPADICNFKCDFCFHKHDDICGKCMDIELFKKIVCDMKKFNHSFKMVHLNGFGEPLLNRNIIEFIELLKKENLAEIVSITSNGSMLNEKISKELINAGLDKIHFSIYGLDDAFYKKFCSQDASFKQIYENIKYMYSIREHCHIHVKIDGNYFDEEQKKLFLDMFGEISDTIYIDRAENIWPGLKVVEKTEGHVYFENNHKVTVCSLPFYQLVIHSNGLVSPCCVDYKQSLIIGDLNRESLYDIWNGGKLRDLRRKIIFEQIGKEKSLCASCQYPSCAATVDLTPYKKQLKELY